MAMTAQEFLSYVETGSLEQAAHCVDCGRVLQESITGCRHTARGYVDSDCYFDAIGKIVEAQPIQTFRIRRG